MKYKKELRFLQSELTQLQRHVRENNLKVVVLFEGRDAAGKGGMIRRIAECLNPNHLRVVAKGKPTSDEQKQWYFQRWVKEMPREGEIVLFDRSWYTRAGVESVMGFATKEEVNSFLSNVNRFEKMLIEQGVIVIKYWLSITQSTQETRFHRRLNTPTKQWKLSPMDIASREKWAEYTKAKERMFRKSHTEHCPWNIVDTNDKKAGHLSCIRHMLSCFTYEHKPHEPTKLPHVFPSKVYNSEFDGMKVN